MLYCDRLVTCATSNSVLLQTKHIPCPHLSSAAADWLAQNKMRAETGNISPQVSTNAQINTAPY